MRRSSLLVPILGLLAASPAGAALIYQENFNSAVGLQYTVTGGGVSANGEDFWARSVAPADPITPAFTGGDGSAYWAARDLDALPGGGGQLRRVELNNVSLTGYTGVTVSIQLAANTGVWDPVAAGDYLRLYAVNAVGGAATLLDEFHSFNGGADTTLESTTFDNVQVNTAFRTFTYNVPVTIGTLRFRFEAASTGDLEWFGVDNVIISGTPVPEPASAALVAFAVALLAGARRASLRQARRGATITLP